MGKLEEFLAGCPRDKNQKKMVWQSCRAFPGLMINRMYILLTRPKEAIRVFGTGDYKTPFWFFFFFTIILAFLQSLASLLQMSFFGMFPMYQPSISNALDNFFSNCLSSLVFGTFYHTIDSFLLLGLSVIILTTGLWCITGVRSWNPAFTITAYCLPVQMLIYTALAILQIPLTYNDPLSGVLGLVFTIMGITVMFVIGGYGIVALTKTPLMTAVIIALFWIVIWMLVTGVTREFILQPFRTGFEHMITMISQTYFPQSFPTASALGKNP